MQKTNIGVRTRIREIPCLQIFKRNEQLWLFGPKLAPKWILRSEFEKPKCGFKISTSKIPCVPIFSENQQLLIFRPKFGEITQLRPIFWIEYCWGCCRELGGGWNELGGSGWNWVEVEIYWVAADGAGWRWMELSVAGCTV